MQVDKSNMKRPHSESPSRDGDKKSCVGTTPTLECICPIITQFYPDVNMVKPTVFVDLIRDLKNSKRKIQLIQEDFFMQPQFVTEVLAAVISDQSLDKTIKNRLKNLHKSLTRLILQGEEEETHSQN
uniref:Uncharacterized protein n=1 Tax=Cacopsylla melanoneura TaxID=428564 RepID=A0A8D8M7R1_9HEMI